MNKPATVRPAVLALLAAMLSAAGTAQAAAADATDYPVRPIRLIVPSPPGGGTDSTSRTIAPKLAELLKQNIVIDNRPGASGNLGAEVAAKAPADGYTLLSIIASHTSNPAVMRHVPFDLVRDFAPISRTVTLPNVVVSHPSVPAKNTRELIAFIKSRPGQVQFASGGIGANQHFAMELLVSMAGLKMNHIPYKGVAPAVSDVIAGHVPVAAANIVVVLPHIKSGRLRAYGVTSLERASAAPDIPPIAETLPGYEAVQWYGMVAPAKTPAPIISKLHASLVKVLSDPAMKNFFAASGAEATPSASPAAYAEQISAEITKWQKIARQAGIKPE